MASPFRNFAFGFLAIMLFASLAVSAASCGASMDGLETSGLKARNCYDLNIGDSCTNDLSQSGTCVNEKGTSTDTKGRLYCVCSPSGSASRSTASLASGTGGDAGSTASTVGAKTAATAKITLTGLTLYNMNKYGFYSTDEDTITFTYAIDKKEQAEFKGFAPFLNLPNEGKLGNEIGVVSLSGCEVDSASDTTGICKLVQEKLAGSGGFVAKLDASKKTLSIGLKNPTAAVIPVKTTVASTAGAVGTTASAAPVETTSEDTAKMAQIAAAGYLYSLADGSHFFTLEGYDCKDKGSDEFTLAIACSKKLQETKTGSDAAPVVLKPEEEKKLDQAVRDAEAGKDSGVKVEPPKQPEGAPAKSLAEEPPTPGGAEVEITALYTDGSDGLNVDKAKDKLFLNFKLPSPCKADTECTYSLKIGTAELLKDAKLKGSDKLERHITIALTKAQKTALKTGSPDVVLTLKRKAADGKETSVEGKAKVTITETKETEKPKVGKPAPEKKALSSGSGSPSGGSSIKDDSKCTAAGGTCKDACASNCGGGTCKSLLCTGATSRQCCVPKAAAPAVNPGPVAPPAGPTSVGLRSPCSLTPTRTSGRCLANSNCYTQKSFNGNGQYVCSRGLTCCAIAYVDSAFQNLPCRDISVSECVKSSKCHLEREVKCGGLSGSQRVVAESECTGFTETGIPTGARLCR